MLNSTSTSCYYAKVLKDEIIETGVVNKCEVENIANGDAVVILKEEHNILNISYNNCKVVNDLSNLYQDCVIRKLNTMEYGDFTPYYLQLSQAERNLKDVN